MCRVGMEHGLGQAEVGGCGQVQLVGQVVGAGDTEVAAEGCGQFRRDHPVRPREARCGELLAQAGDTAFDVGRRAGALVRDGAGQDHVGVGVDRLGGMPGHRHDEVAGAQRLLGHGSIGEVAQRVGAQQDERRDPGPLAGSLAGTAASLAGRLAGHGGEDAGRIEPGRRGHGAPGRREPLATRLEARPGPAGVPGPGPCPARRTRCPGGAPGGRWPWAAPAPGRGPPRPSLRPTRRTRRGPGRSRRPRHRHHRAADSARRAVASTSSLTDDPSGCAPSAVLAASSPQSARATTGASPGRMPSDATDNAVNAVGVGVNSIKVVAPTTASRRRRKSTGSSSRRSPASVMRTGAAHAASIVARGRPRTKSAGRPSPNWASTESVPRMPLANLAQA